jgi:hypothetical protein
LLLLLLSLLLLLLLMMCCACTIDRRQKKANWLLGFTKALRGARRDRPIDRLIGWFAVANLVV